jgi:hypothetical protein
MAQQRSKFDSSFAVKTKLPVTGSLYPGLSKAIANS